MTFFSVRESEFEDNHVTLGRFCNREGSIPSGCCAFWCPHRGCLGRQHQQGVGRLPSAHRIPEWHLARLAFCRNEGALFGRELQAQDSSAKTSSAQRMLSQHFQCHFFCDTSTVSHRTSRIFWNLSCQDCINANITVMGQTMDARFRMNCSADPCQLDIEVLPKGSSCHLSKMNSMYLFLFLTRL